MDANKRKLFLSRRTLHFPRGSVDVSARSIQVIVVAAAQGDGSDCCGGAAVVSDHRASVVGLFDNRTTAMVPCWIESGA